MSVDQVVTRQIHGGMMDGVNEIGLHHGVVSMLHGTGCVDYIHLETENANRQQSQTLINRWSRHPV